MLLAQRSLAIPDVGYDILKLFSVCSPLCLKIAFYLCSKLQRSLPASRTCKAVVAMENEPPTTSTGSTSYGSGYRSGSVHVTPGSNSASSK